MLKMELPINHLCAYLHQPTSKKNKASQILTPGRCGSDFKSIIFKLIMQKNNYGTHCEIA